VSEELGRQLLAGRALFALLLGMFAITVGCGIVLPILRFLIERLTATADAAILSWHTGLLTGTYILAIFLFSETEHGEESSIRSLMPHVPLLRDCPFVITGRFAAHQPLLLRADFL
jgi:hypothetical protein